MTMKTIKMILISVIVFGLLIGGVITLRTLAPEPIPVDVTCHPFFISEEDPVPQEFRITLKLPKPYKHEDIDPSTILVEGLVPMKAVPDWPKVKRTFFAFKVDGEQLMYWVVYPRVWHMQPLPHTRVDIDLTVTGSLYTSETFEGTFTLTVFTLKPELNNPHPPP
jgi:hypothetical protein